MKVNSLNNNYELTEDMENSSYEEIIQDEKIHENFRKKKKFSFKKASSSVSKGVSKVADKAKDAANKAKEAADKAAKEAADKAKEAANKAKEAADKVAKEAADKAKEAANKAKEAADKAKKEASKAADKLAKTIKKIISQALKGITSALNEIMKLIKPLKKFFNNFIKMWKKFESASKFFNKKENVIAFSLTAILPLIGQIIGRFLILNGSLDKPWLFFFAIPPFSFVPALYMMFGEIKPLKGGLPWDDMVWIPIITTVIGTIIAKGNKTMNVFKMLFSMGGFMVAYWMKSKTLCPGGIDNDKILLDSVLSYMFILIFALALPVLPFVKIFVKVIQAVVPQSDLAIQALAVLCAYVGTNVVNGSFGGHCKAKINDEDVYKIIFSAIVLTFITAFSTGDVTTMVMNMANK